MPGRGAGFHLKQDEHSKLLRARRSQRLHHLAQSMIPLAGLGVVLGLSAITLALLRGEGIFLPWINALRLALLIGASAWSLWLAWRILQRWKPGTIRMLSSLAPVVLALLWVDSAWGWLFWWW